jgi:hypothetical protein
MRRIYCIFLLIFLSSFSFGLVNQNVCIIAKNPEDSVFEMLLENELSKSTNINIYYSFKYDENTDPLEFMFSQKISGLIVINKSNLTIYNTKGEITNLAIRDQNIQEFVNLIISLFPPKEKEKIVKEIEKIDYVSQLEEYNPKHSISIGLGINRDYSKIVSDNRWYEQGKESGSKILPIIEYSLNTRYIYFSLGLGIPDIGISDRWKLSSQLGLWLFKSFLLIGIESSLIKLSYETKNFKDRSANYLQTQLSNFSLTLLNLTPLLKFKFSKKIY